MEIKIGDKFKSSKGQDGVWEVVRIFHDGNNLPRVEAILINTTTHVQSMSDFRHNITKEELGKYEL